MADRVGGRDNVFSILRFVAAGLVIFSHSYPLSGHVHDEPLARWTGIMDFGGLAVIVFFVISGFLVAQSADRSTTLKSFLAARFLRIWPGLVVAALVTMSLIAPLANEHGVIRHFLSPDAWLYPFRVGVLDVGARIPGVFTQNPVAGGVNGSLWTVQVEVWLYAVMALLLAAGVLGRRWLSAVLVGGMMASLHWGPAWVDMLYPRSEAFMTSRLISCFFAGVLIYQFRSLVVLSPFVAVGLVGACWWAWNTVYFGMLFYLTAAYLTIFIAFLPANRLSRTLDKTDLSYGLYIYAFPIQQLLVARQGGIAPLELFVQAFAITFVLAYLSWRFVESPALGLKRRFSGRRVSCVNGGASCIAGDGRADAGYAPVCLVGNDVARGPRRMDAPD